MTKNTQFVRFASICAFATAITTIGIHAFFEFPGSFEERIYLFENPRYTLSKWWVIVHCLMVACSMAGFYWVRRNSPLALLGSLSFCVFSITEIARQFMVLFHLNGLRRQYVVANTPEAKELIQWSMENVGLMGLTMFAVFIFFFGLGNLCYGLTLWGSSGFSKLLSILLILWAFGTLVALGNESWQIPWVFAFLGKFNLFYQPLMRILLGYWLWTNVISYPYDSSDPVSELQ